jgi:hypothetical protein
MARATDCELNGQVIDVDKALELRDQARASGQPGADFRCVECGEPVRPHNEGSQGSAHVEHHSRNASCGRSDLAR